MLGCIQPMSSPMVKRILGFCCCCADACELATVTAARICGLNGIDRSRRALSGNDAVGRASCKGEHNAYGWKPALAMQDM
jgi:hypothetical protein